MNITRLVVMAAMAAMAALVAPVATALGKELAARAVVEGTEEVEGTPLPQAPARAVTAVTDQAEGKEGILVARVPEAPVEKAAVEGKVVIVPSKL